MTFFIDKSINYMGKGNLILLILVSCLAKVIILGFRHYWVSGQCVR